MKEEGFNNIIWLDEIDSTNRYAADRFENLPDATLVIAGRQTAGRGRHQRVWISPPNENIYASFVVKNFPYPIHKSSWIGSLAVLDTFAEIVPELDVWLKWPNDVYCKERKIAGLLCEGIHGTPPGAVIGIGVNINMQPEVLDRIDQPATSVLRETGKKLILKNFIKSLAKHLCRRYISGSIHIEGIYNEWKSKNFILNRPVEISTGRKGEVLKGKVVDIGEDGDLYFNTGEKVVRLFSGDVRINRNSLF